MKLFSNVKLLQLDFQVVSFQPFPNPCHLPGSRAVKQLSSLWRGRHRSLGSPWSWSNHCMAACHNIPIGAIPRGNKKCIAYKTRYISKGHTGLGYVFVRPPLPVDYQYYTCLPVNLGWDRCHHQDTILQPSCSCRPRLSFKTENLGDHAHGRPYVLRLSVQKGSLVITKSASMSSSTSISALNNLESAYCSLAMAWGKFHGSLRAEPPQLGRYMPGNQFPESKVQAGN